MKTVQETPGFKINKKTIVIRDYVDLTPNGALRNMRVELLKLNIANCAYTECIKTDEVSEEGQVSTMLCFYFNDTREAIKNVNDILVDIYNRYASSQTKRIIEEETEAPEEKLFEALKIPIRVEEEDPILKETTVIRNTTPIDVKVLPID